MATFQVAQGWDAKGWLDDAQYMNHESNLNADEMKALAAQTLSIPGLQAITAPAHGHDPFYDLSQALQSNTATIWIVKGIHQRGGEGSDPDVHFTLDVPVANFSRLYHIYIGEGAERTQRVVNSSKTTYIERVRVPFYCLGASCIIQDTRHTFPPAFATPGVRRRGGSICIGNTSPNMTFIETMGASPIPSGVSVANRVNSWL